MFLIYSLLLTVGFLALIPFFLLKREKYAAGFRQRFGYLPEFKQDGRRVLWLHCVSVGETQAARPLVKRLLEEFPEYRLVVSTTTRTGQNLACEVFKDSADLIFYFPFDWRFTVRRALGKIKPSVVLLMETEIWFNFLRETYRSKAKIALINGRLSEKSSRRYSKISSFMWRIMRYFDLVLVQGNGDAKRFLKLGASSGKIKITGNVKFDQDFDETESVYTKAFRERFAITKDKFLIVAASTHAPEERWILQAFNEIRKNAPDKFPGLLIAPRHPERFEEVLQEIEKSGFSWTRRSASVSAKDQTADVVLLDSIGELRAVFPLAEIVFVGGSLIPHGGHSILEPALAEKAIVTGFYTMNFDSIMKEFLAQDAVVQLPKLEEKEIVPKLTQILSELLENAERREKLAANSLAVMRKNRGAVEKTVEFLRPLLRTKSDSINE